MRTTFSFHRWAIGLVLSLMLMGCQKPVQVLIVAGGHDFDTLEFFETFRNLEGVQTDSAFYPEAKELFTSEEIESYDVLVFYDFLPGMSPADSTLFLDLTGNGTPLLFLHHALGTSQQWEGYKHMVGGRYVMPRSVPDSTRWSDFKHDIDMRVEIVDPEHPVTLGMEDFTIHDEGYSNLTVLPGVTPLLRTDHADSHPLLGWTHQYGESRIVYLMLGHDRHAYAHPSFTTLMTQTIHWLHSAN